MSEKKHKLPQPALTGIALDKTYVNGEWFDVIAVEISNLKMKSVDDDRYSFFYSYDGFPTDLKFENQMPVKHAVTGDSHLGIHFKEKKTFPIWMRLPKVEKTIYLSVFNSVKQIFTYQVEISPDKVEEMLKQKNDIETENYWYDDTTYIIKQASELKIEAYKQLPINGVDWDYYSVSFPCNNNVDHYEFDVQLTPMPNAEDSFFTENEILKASDKRIEDPNIPEIEFSYVRKKRGHVVFSVPTFSVPHFINVVNRRTGQFYSRIGCPSKSSADQILDYYNTGKNSVFENCEIYQRWLKSREPLQSELVRQKEHTFKDETKFSIVIIVTADNMNNLDGTLSTLFSQTYTNFEIVLSCALTEDEVRTVSTNKFIEYYKEREAIKVVSYGNNASITECYYEGAAETRGDFIGFLRSGDELAPDALFEFKKFIDDNDDAVAYLCHEDYITKNGYENPHFHGGRLYVFDMAVRNYNYCFVFFDGNVFRTLEAPESNIDGAENYYALLYMGEPIYCVDRVLCHHRYNPYDQRNAGALIEAHKNGCEVVNTYATSIGNPTLHKCTPYPLVYDLDFDDFPEEEKLVVIVNDCDIDVLDSMYEWDRCGWLYELDTKNPKKILSYIQETCNGLTLYLENIADIDMEAIDACARMAYYAGPAVVPKLTNESKLIVHTGIITEPNFHALVNGGEFTYEEGLDYRLKVPKHEELVSRYCIFLRGCSIEDMYIDDNTIVRPGGIIVDPRLDVTINEDFDKKKLFCTERYLDWGKCNGGQTFFSYQMAEHHIDAWRDPNSGEIFY